MRLCYLASQSRFKGLFSLFYKDVVCEMFEEIKKYLKKFPALLHFVRFLRGLNQPFRLLIADISSGLLSRSKKMVDTPYGFKLVGSNSIHHVSMQNGTFEPEETALFLDIFKTSDVFVDIGANIGFYSCLARQAGLHVITVEPLQKNLDYIYRNFLANGWKDIEIFPVGVSEATSIATLFGGSSTGPSLIPSWAGASQMFHKNIPLSTLDRIVGNNFSGKRVFIKIDIEGAEYFSLLGAINTLDILPKPVWVIEICFNEYHPEGMNPYFQKTFNLFWEHGYEIRTANKDNKLITPEDLDRWIKAGYADSGTINYKFSSRDGT